jgi:hypothetical protein
LPPAAIRQIRHDAQGSLVMILRWLLSIAIATSIICLFWIVVATDVAGAYDCHARLPAERAGRWSWREVDGRRCWYRGPRGVSKRSLRWPAAVTSPATTGVTSSSPQRHHHRRRSMTTRAMPRRGCAIAAGRRCGSLNNDREIVLAVVVSNSNRQVDERIKRRGAGLSAV